MKTYVRTTGILFALLVMAHVWRFVEEGSGVARDPWFVGFTLLAVALCAWSWRLLRAGGVP